MKTITINGNEFEVSQPYAEGHVLTVAEAKALNQVRAENIANNFRADVKEAGEDANALKKVREAFAEYDKSYIFSAFNARTPIDPLDAEVTKLAKKALHDAIKEAGMEPKTYAEQNAEKYEANLEALKADEALMAQAKQVLKAREQLKKASAKKVAVTL